MKAADDFPLHVAAAKGDAPTVTALLDARALVNAPGNNGYTALQVGPSPLSMLSHRVRAGDKYPHATL